MRKRKRGSFQRYSFSTLTIGRGQALGGGYLAQAGDFVHGLVVGHHHVAGPQGRPEHLVQVGPVYRLQTVRGQRGQQRHVRPAVQRYGYGRAPTGQDAAVAAVVDEIYAGVVDKYKPINMLLNKYLYE